MEPHTYPNRPTFLSTIIQKSQKANAAISQSLRTARHNLRVYRKNIARVRLRSPQKDVDQSPSSPVSPIQQLPNEILDEILVLTLSGTEAVIKEDHSSTTVKIPALTLGRVSSRWRSLCLGYKQLYSTFSVVLRQSVSVDNGPKSDAALRFILEWSGGSPLNVTLTVRTEHDHPTLNTLLAASQRFRSLTLRYVPPTFGAIFDRLRGNLPLLEQCSVTSPLPDSQNDIFVDAPRLHSVQLLFLPYPDEVMFPYDQIKSLDVDCGSDPTVIQDALEKYKNLLTLKISTSWRASQVGPRAQPVLLANLQTLSIKLVGEYTRNALKYILRNLYVPSLLSLTISEYCTGPFPLRQFSSFFSRSCILKSLTLVGDDTVADASSLLPLVPSLTTLIIWGYRRSDEFLFFNPAVLQNPSVLPSLENLTLSMSAGSVPDEDFVEIATSRWREGALRSFRLHVLDRTLSQKAYEAFDTLRSAGLAVTIADERDLQYRAWKEPLGETLLKR